VIASGGCGSYADMLAAIHAGADAVAAGAVFAFTDCTPRGAAKFLRENGVCVRL
jgi:imidazole glycerol phosphate synthase subunit HisF